MRSLSYSYKHRHGVCIKINMILTWLMEKSNTDNLQVRTTWLVKGCEDSRARFQMFESSSRLGGWPTYVDLTLKLFFQQIWIRGTFKQHCQMLMSWNDDWITEIWPVGKNATTLSHSWLIYETFMGDAWSWETMWRHCSQVNNILNAFKYYRNYTLL